MTASERDMQPVLDAIKELQSILDDAKESIDGGVHLRLCTATLTAYERAEALSAAGEGRSDEEEDDDEEEMESESDEEPRERTEDDMELNELSDLWECQFDFGRWNAVLPLEGLIETIDMDFEEKRVCAAVRVLNRALKGSKTDDPEDAERILQWKEDFIEKQTIRACAEILKGDREFSADNDDSFMYSCLCDEILELFFRLGENDALFRTKLRRNGALKAVQAYHASGRGHATEDVLNMLKGR